MCGNFLPPNVLMISKSVVFLLWGSFSCLVRNVFVSTGCVKVFELSDYSTYNYLREAPTLVIPIFAVAMGENPPCLALVVCSYWI